MVKLFISYRRKSWAFTHRMADELAHRLDTEIFVDLDSIDEDDFERAILKHLPESDAFLLVVSEHTFADRIHKDNDWVRREIREALDHEIPIVLVAVEGRYPPSGLPEDIKDIAHKQGIAFYPEYFSAACDRLAEFVVKIGAAQYLRTTVPPPTQPSPDSKRIKGGQSLNEALDLLEDGDFTKGIFILEALLEQGLKTQVVNIQAVLDDAYVEQKRFERVRLAQLHYEEIVLFARNHFTQKQALPAWQQWCTNYPDLIAELDTENLHATLQEITPETTPLALPNKKQNQPRFTLPDPFEWVKIPVGQVTLKAGKSIFDVPAFQIAQYPVTVAQYELFIQDDGYQNSDYWTQTGWQWHVANKITLPAYWNNKEYQSLWQSDHPIVGVSWFEAYAFGQWLARKTDQNITLSTEQQWQRAAQGNDGREYPWGNDWDSARCNNDVDGKNWQKKKEAGNMTSSVLKYAGRGDSPFDVVDMAGNVWEWCLTDYDTVSNDDIENVNKGRVLRGGSWYYSFPYVFRCVYRNWNYPHDRDINWGFRLVLS